MKQIRTQGQMTNFRIGLAVRFADQSGLVRGVIKSRNRKSVTVITDYGCQWRVSPHLLSSRLSGAVGWTVTHGTAAPQLIAKCDWTNMDP